MDTDSNVGNETRWDGLPDDIAGDDDDGRIAVENGSFLRGRRQRRGLVRGVLRSPRAELSDCYQIPRIQR